jgi:alpha-galactosidase
MTDEEIVAVRIKEEVKVDATHPSAAWQTAVPIAFCSDWQGKNPDPARETQVRALWSPQTLYLRFECRYQELFLFRDSDPDGRRDHLWDRDVAEVFLQPDLSRERHYKEFEVSPNGLWVDLDIFPGGRADLNSGMMRSIALEEVSRRWTAEVAIPMQSLTVSFDPNVVWRVNFFRVEGAAKLRHYMAWQPTHSPRPNFHVPGAFGRMRFEK